MYIEDLAIFGAEGGPPPQHRTPGAARQRRDRRRRGLQQGKDVAARSRRRPRSGGSRRRRRHGVEPQGLCKARVDVFGGELESHAVDGSVAASQEEKRDGSSGSSRRNGGGRGIVKVLKRQKRVGKHKIKSSHNFMPNSQNFSRKIEKSLLLLELWNS